VVLKELEDLVCFRQGRAVVRDPLAVLLKGRSLWHVGLTTGIGADDEWPLPLRAASSRWVRPIEGPMHPRRIGLPRFVRLSAVSGSETVASCTASKPP
jgi:hypothetical protein